MADSVEVKLSDRITVTIRPLNGMEEVRADQIIGALSSPGAMNEAALMKSIQTSFNPMVMQKIYAACAVRSRNGIAVDHLKNDAEVAGFLSELTGAELRELTQKYNEISAPPEGEDLKNLSSDSPSAQ